MKKLAVLLLLVPGLALANTCNETYGGVRVSQRSMGFKSNYGDSLFAKNLTQFSIFGGYNFNHWLGAELDLFTTNNKKKNPTIVDAQTELGVPDFSGLGADTYKTKTELTGATLQLTARYRVVKQLNVFATAGVGLAKLRVKANMTENDGSAATALEQANNKIDQSKTKLYPVIGVGADWRFNHHVGVKANVSWEGTSTLKMKFQTPAGAPNNYQVKPKSSVVYGLGVYYVL